MTIIQKLPIIFPVLCLLTFGVHSLSNAQTVFEAQLSGSNEVPAHTSSAMGDITATLTGSELVVEGSFEGLTGDYSASHIHLGMAGEGGGVIFPLTADIDMDNRGGTYAGVDNTFDLTAGQIDTLNARGMYVNVHSSTYPGGEIRGQLVPQSEAYFRTNLSGAFEVPAVKTRGSGSAVLELRDDTLYVSGSFSKLSEAYTASHIHAALTGTNGGVSFGLTPTLGEDELSGKWLAEDNKFELTTEQQATLWNREFYINVHTSANLGGELRGQITPPVTASFFASLSGTAQNPSLNVEGSGALTIEVTGDSLFASGSFSGLESGFTASHIHMGFSSANGGVVIPLTAEAGDDTAGTYASSDNSFELNTEQKELLFDRWMYVNVHTENNPGGALRGQVLGDATAYFRTKLSGLHSNDPIFETEGYGSVDAELSGDRLIVSGGFRQLAASYSASHIHAGSVSGNGGVEVGLNPTVEEDTSGIYEVSSNTYSLDVEEGQVDLLYEEGTYINVHTSANPGGEIRGQLLFGNNIPPTPIEFTSPEDGAEFTISGDFSTTFNAEWGESMDPDGNELRNIWALAADENFDDILILANVESDTSAEVSFGTLDSILVDLDISLDASTTLYHSVLTSDGSNFAYGETRTVIFTRGTVTSNEDEDSNTPHEFSLEQNYPNPFNPATNISFSLTEPGEVEVRVFNMLGQEVAVLANKKLSAGNHNILFNAENLSSGVYIYQLKAEGKTETRQMTLIK